MKFCPECGNPVEGYKFCPNCGFSIANQEPTEQPQPVKKPVSRGRNQGFCKSWSCYGNDGIILNPFHG